MTNLYSRYIIPANILIASIIGAGMFSLPSVFHAVGLLATIVYLVVFAFLASYIHLIYADVIHRAHAKHHHFPSYIKLYLGKRAGIFATWVMLVTLLLTLTAFLILSTSFFHILIPTLPPLSLLLLFWAIGTAFAFITIKGTALFDTITATVTLAAIAGIFFYWGHSTSIAPSLFPSLDASSLLAPFGPILFSFLGFSAVPAVMSYTRAETISRADARKAIIIGSFVPAFFYFLFVIAIWGLSPFVSIDSISGLSKNVPSGVILMIGLLGFVSLWDSYASVSRDISKVIQSEFSLSQATAFLIVAATPLALFFLGFQNFITVIGIVGGVLFGIWGILIVLAWLKAVATHTSSVKFSTIHIPTHTTAIPSAVPYILLAVFGGGILYELIHFVNPF